MLKPIAPIVPIMLLSGCAALNNNTQQDATVSAIKASELTLLNKMAILETQLGQQNDYMRTLDKRITNLSGQIEQVKSASKARLATEAAKVTPTATPTPAPVKKSQGIVLGEIERVVIDSIKQKFDARIDTGAATSSLNAIDVKEFERNGKKWVRFHLSDGEVAPTDNNWIEARVIRYVKIKQSTSEEMERRAVVELWVKLGNIHEKAQFTLADRSQMNHPILLGREFIRDIAVVDVSRKYIHTKK